MLKTAAEYGLLATALLLLVLVGQYALFLRPTVASWIVGAAAAAVLAAGIWLGRRHFGATAAPADGPEAKGARRSDAVERFGISEREFEVLELVAAGLSNQEIADKLFIAETTVKSHVSSLLTKLDARRRTEAVSRALEEGLL